MHWANNGVRVARGSQQCHQCPCHFLKKSHSSGNGNAPDIYTANPTPHSAIYRYIFLTLILRATGSSQGSESHCPATQRCQSVFLGRNASSHSDDHSSRCWNTRVASFGALISIFSSHEQTSKQILKAILRSDVCLQTAKQEHFLPQIQV